METRRVVTTVTAAQSSDFAHDGPAPRAVKFDSIPGHTACLFWASDGVEKNPSSLSRDISVETSSWVPSSGGSRLLKVTFPPDSVFASPEFNPAVAGEETAAKLPGLAELFERENPGVHRTPTLDYGVVLDGEIWLELDEGRETHLSTHDVVIQCATRHAWRNRSARPTTMLFVLLGL
ncbi:cupin domain-containing protein [Paraburkholderia sp. HD33-4]|uniref:cupin domain-containing protein n=1 Tax=Paraburkholderia sp. HD33-4 TaxID=2883242 RepID=UPI001F2AACF0|nr:cupin domain-containing protein [Paraburkholderia sp. HD33-4]